MRAHPSPEALERLLALVGEALALSDAQALHATGIALDAARLSVAEALDEARRTHNANDPIDSIPSGAGFRERG